MTTQSWITSDTWNKVDLNIVGGPLSRINEIVLVVNEIKTPNLLINEMFTLCKLRSDNN